VLIALSKSSQLGAPSSFRPFTKMDGTDVTPRAAPAAVSDRTCSAYRPSSTHVLNSAWLRLPETAIRLSASFENAPLLRPPGASVAARAS
jgi:hypothetical protein